MAHGAAAPGGSHFRSEDDTFPPASTVIAGRRAPERAAASPTAVTSRRRRLAANWFATTYAVSERRAASSGMGTRPIRKYENARRSARRRTIWRNAAAPILQSRMNAACAAMARTMSSQQPLSEAARSITNDATRAATRTAIQMRVDFLRVTCAYSSERRFGTSATIGRDVKFLRQAALLLPSAFLLNVLVFLLTHGRDDPGFGIYPFFQAWTGDAASAPESRFLLQSLVFFAPAYAVTLFVILSVSLAERAVFGKRKRAAGSLYGRAFGATFPVLYFVASAAAMWIGEHEALKQAPGSLVAPLLAAAAPFAAAGLALLPAAAAAGPLALLWKAGPA